MISIPYLQLIAIAEFLITTAGPLEDSVLHLYQNPISVGPGTTLPDLTECDFSGYAAVPGVTFLSAYIDVQGRCILPAETVEFQPSNSTITNTVYGWYLTDAGNATLRYADFFTDPKVMASPLNAIILQPDYIMLNPRN